MRRLLLVLLTAVTLFGCSIGKSKSQMPIEKRIELGDHYYERGRYNKAADHYIEVVFERSSNYTPIAQFRLGECHFNLGRYTDAIFEYQELIRLFPEFKDVSVAYYRIGEAHYQKSLKPQYTQEDGHLAIQAFEVYLDRFPYGDKRESALEAIQELQYKFIEKNYNNGYIYYRLYDYSAALMYFDEILELGNRNELDKKTRYYEARIYVKRRDQENALSMLKSLKEYYPESKETQKIERLYDKIF
ncbi:MAG: outer membrane protein assembly factor BamD [Candidatus Cloacimonas sp.]|nr:outer membrane protein assembly factor BamD [Candidatus Cloacimonadota bacterium]